MILDVLSWVSNIFNNIKDFFIENGKNPFLWVIIIIIGLLLFEIIYKSLKKD